MPQPPAAPNVGVGCIVVRNDCVLMVQNHGGYWSTPGGHLDFGESPADCAVRETLEESGIRVFNVEFVAITNDVFEERGKHYVTIWMRAEPEPGPITVHDSAEIADAGWFRISDLPSPLHLYFQNLISERCLPPRPHNLPFRQESDSTASDS
jgi:8-oxo-dGTP diphosphatase